MKNSAQKFQSVSSPFMNRFFIQLFKALENLPDNPKPTCKGFYLAYWDSRKGILTAEGFGDILLDKNDKYLYIATKKATQVLYFKKNRSKEFANEELEQYPGGIKFGANSAGVSGHDSMVDEAIALLWLIANYIIVDHIEINAHFWNNFLAVTRNAQKNYTPDNKWVLIIAKMMVLL